MPVAAIIILGGVGFVLLFTLLWCGICLLLANLGGWQTLTRRYRATAAPIGIRHSGVSARIGGVNYKTALTVHHSADGLHIAVFALLKLGHPDLFIPWHAIEGREDVDFLWVHATRMSVGGTSITLPRELAAQPA